MDNVKVQFIEPDQFYLVDDFCTREGIPLMDPRWARVVAGIDLTQERIVGIMVLQLVAHAEPIWIEEGYQGNGLWKEMALTLDGYLQEMANQGVVQGIYTQPTRDETKAICEKMGMYESEHPLWLKKYAPMALPQQLIEE